MNNDRFMQSLEDLVPSSIDFDTSNIQYEKLLPIGSIVELKNTNYGEVTIIELMPVYKDKPYCFLGEFVDTDGTKKKIYFNRENINSLKSEGKVK